MEYAIFEDCRKLIDYFISNGDMSFPSFCNQWKKLHFEHIYFAQTSYIHTMQTTGVVIHYAKRELCCREENNTSKSGPDNLKIKNSTAQHFTDERIRRKIGCLYLLYAIYFKQPTEGFIKIETSLNTWQNINNFINSLPMTPEMDSPRYVFLRLVASNAFRFTALDYCVGLDELVDYEKLNDKDNTDYLCKSSGKELGQQLKDFPATQRILPALSVLEDGYNEMKEMLIKTNTSGIHKKSLPSTTIFKTIGQCFQNIQTILEDDEERVKKYKSSCVENKRRNLKRKGFANSIVGSKIDTETAMETKNNKYKSLRRMSCRTVFTDELPADLLDDLEEDAGSTSLDEQEAMESSDSETMEENVADIPTNSGLKECKLEHKPPNDNQEKVIEKEMNELLEVELNEGNTEEFIQIPSKEKYNACNESESIY